MFQLELALFVQLSQERVGTSSTEAKDPWYWGEGVGEAIELGTRPYLRPAIPHRSVEPLDAHAIEEQHVATTARMNAPPPPPHSSPLRSRLRTDVLAETP